MTLLILVLLAASAGAEELTAEVRATTINSLFVSMRKSYVFPEKVGEAEKLIKGKLAARGYDSISSGEDFAKQLTRDLDSVCHDAHLRVRYSAEMLPIRKQDDKPSPSEIAKQKLWTKQVNAGFQKVERLAGNIGYIKFTQFAPKKEAERPIRAAMDFVANTDALIFDIRENGGGSPQTVQLLCSYLFDSKPVHLNDISDRTSDDTEQFWTLPKVSGSKYLGKEIYILVSKRTGSAAEEFSYDLQNTHRATIIGEPTWGGANPGDEVRLNDHFKVFVPFGRSVNPYTKTNWEGTGVRPDIYVPAVDALKTAHVMLIKHLLEKATDAEEKSRLTESLARTEKG